MRADLDRLMAELDLDGIIVLGDETPNTFRTYLTSGVSAGGQIFKKRGEPAVYIVNGMELDEAAKSGLVVKTAYDFGMAELAEKYGADQRTLSRELRRNIFNQLGIRGRIGFFGTGEVSALLPLLMDLQDGNYGIEPAIDDNVLQLVGKLYETKDEQEIAALREAGRLTSQVVRDTWDFISQHFATGTEVGSHVVNEQGQPLTIGAVKRFLRLRHVELGLEEAETIFAQGRDAGMPHSRGEDDDILQVGKSIVFDIFPKVIKNGYYHDMTRTWCIGHAPVDVQAAYDDVMHIFRQVNDAFKLGERTARYQEMTLDYFEAQGHPTHRSRPGTLDGYVHSLGHGLGLNVHEAPGFGLYSKAIISPNSVFTVEPGLYYPDRGYGIRIEDTVYIDANGKLHTLTDFPYDLVLPIRTRG